MGKSHAHSFVSHFRENPPDFIITDLFGVGIIDAAEYLGVPYLLLHPAILGHPLSAVIYLDSSGYLPLEFPSFVLPADGNIFQRLVSFVLRPVLGYVAKFAFTYFRAEVSGNFDENCSVIFKGSS
jgi:hypothetical protein